MCCHEIDTDSEVTLKWVNEIFICLTHLEDWKVLKVHEHNEASKGVFCFFFDKHYNFKTFFCFASRNNFNLKKYEHTAFLALDE